MGSRGERSGPANEGPGTTTTTRPTPDVLLEVLCHETTMLSVPVPDGKEVESRINLVDQKLILVLRLSTNIREAAVAQPRVDSLGRHAPWSPCAVSSPALVPGQEKSKGRPEGRCAMQPLHSPGARSCCAVRFVVLSWWNR